MEFSSFQFNSSSLIKLMKFSSFLDSSIDIGGCVGMSEKELEKYVMWKIMKVFEKFCLHLELYDVDVKGAVSELDKKSLKSSH